MTFSSLSFIGVFLPILIALYVVIPTKSKNIILLLASFGFYAWGSVSACCILIIFTIINYGLARYIDNSCDQKRKCRILEAVVLNILFLSYFKYYGFLLESIFAFIPNPPSFHLFSIPLGISFFTFSAIGYLFDVYRGTVKAEKNIMLFALYIAFFPKLMMGPIERYGTMKQQFLNHPLSRELFEEGCGKFLIGLAQKLILANTMGTIWMMCNEGSVSMMSAWLGIIAYTFQIYFDFQGYTQMAIGLGNMFGFHLSKNFNYPYMARTVTDFWRRWHMTLSTWFKDYVYIPLGGNRVSFHYVLRNLMIVWCLTGIWHGANWNFIVWGLYHGVLLISEKFIFVKRLESLSKVPRWCITMLCIMIGWVFFASNGIQEAMDYLGSMFMLRGNGVFDTMSITLLRDYGVYFILCIIGCTPIVINALHNIQSTYQSQLWYLKPIATLCFLCILASFLLSNTYQSFLYFKF